MNVRRPQRDMSEGLLVQCGCLCVLKSDETAEGKQIKGM